MTTTTKKATKEKTSVRIICLGVSGRPETSRMLSPRPRAGSCCRIRRTTSPKRRSDRRGRGLRPPTMGRGVPLTVKEGYEVIFNAGGGGRDQDRRRGIFVAPREADIWATFKQRNAFAVLNAQTHSRSISKRIRGSEGTQNGAKTIAFDLRHLNAPTPASALRGPPRDPCTSARTSHPGKKLRLSDRHPSLLLARSSCRTSLKTWARRTARENLASKTSDTAGDGTDDGDDPGRSHLTTRANGPSSPGSTPVELKCGMDKGCRTHSSPS